MRRLRFARNCAMIAAVGYGVLRLSGCGDDGSVTMPPKGGTPIKPNPFSCFVGPSQDPVYGIAARNARWSGNLVKALSPDNASCPYAVKFAGEQLYAGVQTNMPYGSLASNDRNLTFHGLLSKWTLTQVMPGSTKIWTTDPSNSDLMIAEFDNSYTAAVTDLRADPSSNQYTFAYDSGLVDGSTSYGFAQARVIVTGTAVGGSGYIVVPSSVTTANPTLLRAVTVTDTNSYRFSWLVDGQDPQNPDAQLTTSLSSLPGYHDVYAFARRADNTVDTLHASVYSTFVVSISGPSSVPPYTQYTWSSVIPGGYPPYSYQWTRDGTVVGTAANYTTTFAPSQQHTIALNVTDSHGFTASSSIVVTSTASTSGGGTCLHLPCP